MGQGYDRGAKSLALAAVTAAMASHVFGNLRERFLLLVFIALIPVLAVIIYMSAGQRQQAMSIAEEDTLHLVRLVVREHERVLGETRQLLVALSRLPIALKPEASECSGLLSDIRGAYRFLINIGIATIDGRIRCSAITLPGPVDISDRIYFQRAVATRGLGVGEYQIGRVTGAHTLNLGYPVIEGGEVRSVVYAALDLSWLGALASGLNLPEGSTATVIDSAGTIVARYPEDDGWLGRSISHWGVVPEMLERLGEGASVFTGPDGVDRIYAFAPLYPGTSNTAFVVVGVPKAHALGAAGRVLQQGLTLWLLVGVLVACAAWVASELFVIRPVRALAGAVRRVSEGDLSARSGLPSGRDEIGRLAQDFDAMAAALQRVRGALETLTRANRALTRAGDENALLADMCTAVVSSGSYAAVWVGFLEEADRLLPVARAGIVCLSDPGFVDLPLLPEDHPLRRCLRTDAVVRFWDGEGADRRVELPFPGCTIDPRPKAVAVLPLHLQDELAGVLVIHSREADAFSAAETDLLAELAQDLSYGISALRVRAEHRRAEEAIMNLSSRDRLTGLPNHGVLESALARTELEPQSLLFIDLDRFSEINSALGFQQGDLVLQETARRLREVVGEGGMVARMRGDEFAVLVPADVGMPTALRILEALDRSYLLGDLTLSLTAAVGIVHYPEHGQEAEHLIRRADAAMRQAKASGHRYAVYTPAPDHGARRLSLASDLKYAIEEGTLSLHYQPKLEMRSGALSGAEALVRWCHPRRGMIPPAEFIALAEYTGLIRPLTDYIVAEALAQLRSWIDEGLELAVAVNLSARNLQDPGCFSRISSLIDSSSVDVRWLEIELTESAVMDDAQTALTTLHRLSNAGLRLFVDDFGTGYSSLAYLQKLPVDAVKIDRSFVAEMLEKPELEKIVRSTIDLAHDLELEVVAEGVESQAVWNRLLELGCDVAQGYFIGSPMPPHEFAAWARKRTHKLRPATYARTGRA
jgi:diguanylate cyclase (GGDEF)-like protein